MKKILFASAFALMGTFAMANGKIETKETKKITEEETLQIVCVPIQLSCVEDCLMMDTELDYTREQINAEIDQIEEYNCG
ncbi:hypothetical protein [Empedobacter brevis]|uniref:hypothetical protein n=1 Tax=Empedobacter brevis TaxID=247 RepID=UPI00289C1CD8|nr:hypothetical protein [Empedobacter brevis]